MEPWLASAVIVATGVFIAVMAVDAWLRMRWRRRRLAADVERHLALADLLSKRDAAIVRNLSASRSWSGFRSFRVTRKVREADNVASFHLRPHDGRPVAPYLPGQFLTFRFHDGAEREPTVRCYSLSRAWAGDRDYRVTIKRLAPPPEAGPEAPGGKASSWFHDRLEVDGVVEVAPPAGRFTLDLAAGRPVVFIAGGIGVTPFLAMMEHIEAHEPGREAWLFHGVRSPEERVMHDEMRRWARHPGLHVVTCRSGRNVEPAPGRTGSGEAGHVTIDLLRRRLPSSNYEFYVCGPPPMMTRIMDGLRAWGVPPGSIHFEAFSAGTVREVGMTGAAQAQARPCEISFRGSGRRLEWSRDSGTILELAERNGIFLPSGCRAGNCGTCAVPVLAGSFTCLSRPEARVDDGSCLVCISVPRGDIELA